jgi:hypothetical protein
LCIVSPFVYSCLFPISMQIYRPLPPAGNPITVNKYYIYIYFSPADRARWLMQPRYFLTSIRKDSLEDRFLHLFLVSGWQLRSDHATSNQAMVPEIMEKYLISGAMNMSSVVTRHSLSSDTFHAMVCNRGSVFK